MIGPTATFTDNEPRSAYISYRLHLALTSFIGGLYQTRIINLTLSCERVEAVHEASPGHDNDDNESTARLRTAGASDAQQTPPGSATHCMPTGVPASLRIGTPRQPADWSSSVPQDK